MDVQIEFSPNGRAIISNGYIVLRLRAEGSTRRRISAERRNEKKKRIKDLKNEDDWFLFSSSTMRRDQIPTDTDLDDKTCIVGFKSTSDEILYLRKEFRFAAMVRLLIDEPAEEDKNDPNLAQRLWKAKDPGSKGTI